MPRHEVLGTPGAGSGYIRTCQVPVCARKVVQASVTMADTTAVVRRVMTPSYLDDHPCGPLSPQHPLNDSLVWLSQSASVRDRANRRRISYSGWPTPGLQAVGGQICHGRTLADRSHTVAP